MVLGLQGAASASLIGLVLFLGYVYLQKRADGKEKGFPLCPFFVLWSSCYLLFTDRRMDEMRKKGMLVLGIMAAATAIGIYFGRRRKQA